MGSFEKLVVLTVLFLVVIVLGITLNTGDSETPAASGPLASALERSAGTETAPSRDGFVGGPKPTAGPAAPAQEEAPLALLSATLGDDTLLQSADGLEDAPMIPDFKIYRVAAGDTWTGMSQRFYGSKSYAALLRRANDEPETLRVGMQILVPVNDYTEEAGTRPRVTPSRSAPAQADTTPYQPMTGAPRTSSAPSLGDSFPTAPVNRVSQYEVAPGDSLSVISVKVYGTSRRWEEIFEANSELLEDPDSLQVGQVLRIP